PPCSQAQPHVPFVTMDAAEINPAEGSAGRRRWLDVGALLLLMAWQAWLTLGLFGDGYPWPHLYDDQPIISGAHPQHLSLGKIGAAALAATGCPSAYVPDFQAGF